MLAVLFRVIQRDRSLVKRVGGDRGGCVVSIRLPSNIRPIEHGLMVAIAARRYVKVAFFAFE